MNKSQEPVAFLCESPSPMQHPKGYRLCKHCKLNDKYNIWFVFLHKIYNYNTYKAKCVECGSLHYFFASTNTIIKKSDVSILTVIK